MSKKRQAPKYSSCIKYIVREISPDGLIKKIRSENNYFTSFEFDEYDSIEKAKEVIDNLNRESVKESQYAKYTKLVILPIVDVNVEY